MHILCTICSDLVNPAENINITKCGHIFHHHCLAQWIGRSKTCPQCRNKVTDKCMFRMYPTISNDITVDDAASLQSRLDDAHLQLRQKTAAVKERDDKLATIQADLKKNDKLLKSYETKLETRDLAVAALKEQLDYVKIQNLETKVLKVENENLKKNIQTMNGLQKVLNATTGEVEQMLETYRDVNTLAIFATALKKALCESESKLKESRQKLQNVQRKLGHEMKKAADLQAKVVELEDKVSLAEEKYESLKQRKRKSSHDLKEPTNSEKQAKHSMEDSPGVVHREAPDIAMCEFEGFGQINSKNNRSLNDAILNDSKDSSINSSFNTMVNKIENADSPYLQLRQSNLALTALQQRPQHIAKSVLKPQERAVMNSASHFSKSTQKSPLKATSIFSKKPALSIDVLDNENDVNLSQFNVSFDGFGGHSKVDKFPVPRQRSVPNFIPKLTSKHKLKRPPPPGSQDISKMLEKLNQS